jgi:hypothetical protein
MKESGARIVHEDPVIATERRPFRDRRFACAAWAAGLLLDHRKPVPLQAEQRMDLQPKQPWHEAILTRP